MSRFFHLKVKHIHRETPDAVSIELEIPDNIKKDFQYKQGQYLTFKFIFNGAEIRRSYSLCSAPSVDAHLKVAVKEVNNGLASGYLNNQLKNGDILESMPPMGNFYTELNPSNSLKYVGIAAGSGITPLLSIIKETLAIEKNSTFTLIYANKNSGSVIFKNELDELGVKFAARLKVIHLFSREDSKENRFSGRPDKEKLAEILLAENLFSAKHYFICGPEEMIMGADAILKEKGINKENIHFELFSTPVKMVAEKAVVETNFDGEANVKVIIDGISTEFKLHSNGKSVLDAAMDAGADAPFSCKGAVCCTCKAKVIKGKAIMDMNYALTDKEVEQGFILSCQSHPCTPELEVDFDVS